MYVDIGERSRIKLIGDSITAGRGSSDCAFDGDYILDLDGRTFYRQTGKKCYASLLSAYLTEKYPGCTVVNNGCNSINSYHVCRHFEELVSYSDTAVFLMIGANNRKFYAGLEMLYHDILRIKSRLDLFHCPLVLFTSTPSTEANESRKNRRYHMGQVDEVIHRAAKALGVPHISFYRYFLDYVQKRHMRLEELLLPEEELAAYPLPASEEAYSLTDWNRLPDGLHPPDSVHRMMAAYAALALEL